MPNSTENYLALINRLKEAAFISIVAMSAYILLSLASHNSSDPGWSTTGSGDQIYNLGGIAGAWISDILFSLVGYMAYFFPALLIYRFFRLLLAPRMKGDFSALNLSQIPKSGGVPVAAIILICFVCWLNLCTIYSMLLLY